MNKIELEQLAYEAANEAALARPRAKCGHYRCYGSCTHQPAQAISPSELVSCCACGYEWRRGQTGSHHCATQMAKTIDRLTAERDALRDRMAEIESQTPVLWAPSCASHEFATGVRGYGQQLTVWFDRPAAEQPGRGHCQTPLYARPVPAQPIPDGWWMLLAEAGDMIERMPGYPAGADICSRIQDMLRAAR